jgi:hypothetical protein
MTETTQPSQHEDVKGYNVQLDPYSYVRQLIDKIRERQQLPPGQDAFAGIDITEQIEDDVAHLAGPDAEQAWRQRMISQEYRDVAKVVMAEIIRQCQPEDVDEMMFTVFDRSDNIASFVGDLTDYIDLLKISDQNEGNFHQLLVSEVAYYYDAAGAKIDVARLLGGQDEAESDTENLHYVIDVIRGATNLGLANNIAKNFVASLYDYAKTTDDISPQRRDAIMECIDVILSQYSDDMIYQHELKQSQPESPEGLYRSFDRTSQRLKVAEIQRRNRAESLDVAFGPDLTKIEEAQAKANQIVGSLHETVNLIHENIHRLFDAIDGGEFASELVAGVNERVVDIQKIAARIIEYGSARGGCHFMETYNMTRLTR